MLDSQKILILNGPNLNLLGRREPTIYGTTSFEEYYTLLKPKAIPFSLEYYQSNTEGTLIDKLHAVGFDKKYIGIIFNAGAYTHTSLALADAISAIDLPVVEVHISNIFARETIRQQSLIAAACIGSISGFGLYSYDLALQYFVDL